MKKMSTALAIGLLCFSTLLMFAPVGEATTSDTELYYDDGTAEAGYAWTTTPGVYAVRFSGPEPMQFYRLVKARYCIYSNPYSFRLDIRDSDEQSIFSQVVTPTSVGWFDVSLVSHGVIVKEDFYVAMEYVTPLKPCLGADYGDPDGESYEDPWPLAQITSLDWMIRAVVSPLENLIENPGFEQQLTYWSPTVGTATYSADTSNPRSGSYAARGVEPNAGSLGVLFQDITAVTGVGGQYMISGWIKTEGVTGGGGAAIGVSYVTDIGYTPADGHISGATIGLLRGTADWTFFQSAVFTLPPMPADCVALHFSLDFSDADGTAWWDDVALIEVVGPPQLIARGWGKMWANDGMFVRGPAELYMLGEAMFELVIFTGDGGDHSRIWGIERHYFCSVFEVFDCYDDSGAFLKVTINHQLGYVQTYVSARFNGRLLDG